MKKMSFIVKFIVAFIVAIFAVALCIRYDASDKVVICAYFGVAILTMLALGAFDSADKSASEEGRVKSEEFASAAKRSYGQAAVFIGAACIFIGTPKECEEMADDLQHYAQQVRVDELTGEETSFEIL